MVRNRRRAQKWSVLGGLLLASLVAYCAAVLAGVKNALTVPLVSFAVFAALSWLFIQTVNRLKSS
ncbi:MAG: hypothetical protein JO190_06855 [Candidatus Eremiobacteraeota bacterium]|nr:hypothetical protein [Candidatus Eremiobacteraeota bacterium]MBV8498343.1 hypothetical protein [Candidatus Eremiobacteraeota bacterium]